MLPVTLFDDLPDLIIIEFFSYLSSLDILWGFTRINYRLTMLIAERKFFHHVNLSLTSYHQFNIILNLLPIDEIQSLVIDNDASPLQLTHWPYLPRLRTLRIIGPYSHDDILIFITLHATTLNHLTIESNDRIVPDGYSIDFEYPKGCIMKLVNNIILVHLPELRSFDLGMDYYYIDWPINTVHVPLTYLRIALSDISSLIRIMSTQPLSNTLCQLHVKIANCNYHQYFTEPISNLLIKMTNLHTLTFVDGFFALTRIEWTVFEILISSNTMPVLRRANISLFLNVNDLYCIASSSIFNDNRHVNVNFAFSFINCSEYKQMTQFIPRGNRFHPREIVGATLVVYHRHNTEEVGFDGDPFCYGLSYNHYIWYTLPWAFDEFFQQFLPDRCILNIDVFEFPSKKTTIIGRSHLHTVQASGRRVASPLFSLPNVIQVDQINTLHVSYYNGRLRLPLPNLHQVTFLNSQNCLNHESLLPTTIRSIRLLIFYFHPNYQKTYWPNVLYSLSTLPNLHSLRIIMYHVPTTILDESCPLIEKIALRVTDFGFYFRAKFGLSGDVDPPIFEVYAKFIKHLCHRIFLLSSNKQPRYSIEDDRCGLTIWF
ncbi:unnamed protein product [Rotaria sp. Silwood2]|nr:unnamed protein product [Rotaria sp. Silwood2]CAF4221680.1 unnamed protein product [Rotaria sp. Silwood2]